VAVPSTIVAPLGFESVTCRVFATWDCVFFPLKAKAMFSVCCPPPLNASVPDRLCHVPFVCGLNRARFSEYWA
jgi:hypothetical protein